jgi:transposase
MTTRRSDGSRPPIPGDRDNLWTGIILRERTHPEQGFRACVGILRLVKTYGRERLEAACSRALEIGARSYSSVNSILKNNLDRQRPAKPADGPAIAHDNIRGPTYFH